MGRVLDPLLCVFLAGIKKIGIGACMHVCVWYTELTCISNGASKTKFLIYVKLVFISDTYCILICCYTPIATAQKRNELTLAPPWTELTLNSTGSAGNDYRKSCDHTHRFIKF